MNIEFVEVSYPEIKPYPEMEPFIDIEGEETEARQKREEAYLEAYEKAEAAYVEAYQRRKAFFENDSCRLDGCPNTPKAGLKFCRRHVGIRPKLKKADYNTLLGPGTKVRISE